MTPSCGPFSATTPAFCTNDVMFDVEWPWITLNAVVSSFGAIVQPARQPVIAYVFDSDPADHRPIAMAIEQQLRQVVRHRVVDQVLVAQVDDHPDAALRGRVGDRRRRAASSVSEPVGLHGELMMIAFVFGVIAAMIALRVHGEAIVRASSARSPASHSRS